MTIYYLLFIFIFYISIIKFSSLILFFFTYFRKLIVLKNKVISINIIIIIIIIKNERSLFCSLFDSLFGRVRRDKKTFFPSPREMIAADFAHCGFLFDVLPVLSVSFFTSSSPSSPITSSPTSSPSSSSSVS